jgi:hypothetical protein
VIDPIPSDVIKAVLSSNVQRTQCHCGAITFTTLLKDQVLASFARLSYQASQIINMA